MAESARSSQVRAMLWAADAAFTTPNPNENSKANRGIFARANSESLCFKLSIFPRLSIPVMICLSALRNICQTFEHLD
jgi:hypothetical protein